MNVFLRNKDYRKFSIASFLSGAGDILFYLALMTYASKLKNYSLALSLIAISESVPKVFEIFAGYLADKTKNKFRNIVWMAFSRFVLYGIVGLLLISNLNQWNIVLAIIGINLISDTFGSYSGGLTAPLIVNLVGEKEFGEAEGFTSGISEIINMVAQFVGASLLLFLSYSNLAFVNAATFLIAGLLYASIGLKYRKKDQAVVKPEEVNDQNFLATMKSSFTQLKKEHGLITIILVIAMLNGTLGVIGALVPIVIAAHKTTMIISTYSFTIAIIGVVVSCGFILGSMFGQQLFKNISVFTLIISAIILSAFTTIAALVANIFVILPLYFFLAVVISTASIKMTQWLVEVIDRKILASSMGLLNSIIMVSSPALTTLFTTISGLTNVNYALFGLLGLNLIVLFVASWVSMKLKQKNNLEDADLVSEG